MTDNHTMLYRNFLQPRPLRYLVSFGEREKSILGTGDIASAGRLSAGTAFCGAGGPEHVTLNCEFVDVRSTSRMTRRMPQDEVAAAEQHSGLTMFHQNSGFLQSVHEQQRRARARVNQAVLGASQKRNSIEHGTTGCAAQQRTGPVDERTRNSFNIGNEAQASLGQHGAHMQSDVQR